MAQWIVRMNYPIRLRTIFRIRLALDAGLPTQSLRRKRLKGQQKVRIQDPTQRWKTWWRKVT